MLQSSNDKKLARRAPVEPEVRPRFGAYRIEVLPLTSMAKVVDWFLSFPHPFRVFLWIESHFAILVHAPGIAIFPQVRQSF